jgi:Gluconate 2-dehydrogenase subunit 3
VSTRRSFVSTLAAFTAALGFGSRHRAIGEVPSPAGADADAQVALDLAVLTKIAEVVLPSELGADGMARASRAFAAWTAEYKKGAELVHPYGSPNLGFTGDSPAPRWRQQLDALQRSARERHQMSFTALTRPQREALIREAVAGDRLDRMPSVVGANHVAIALSAFFFGSPEGTDLCYRAKIGKNQCRPLVNAQREPLPLVQTRSGA